MRFAHVLAAALLCGLSFASPAQAQTTYPLNCRAGGNMTVNVLPGATAGTTELAISYDRATVTTGLPAGSCAWVDRPMNTREPRGMRVIVRARISVDVRPRPGDHMGDRADLFVYPGSGPDEAMATAIVSTLKAGGSFQVTAYNPGRGLMVATNFVAR